MKSKTCAHPYLGAPDIWLMLENGDAWSVIDRLRPFEEAEQVTGITFLSRSLIQTGGRYEAMQMIDGVVSDAAQVRGESYAQVIARVLFRFYRADAASVPWNGWLLDRLPAAREVVLAAIAGGTITEASTLELVAMLGIPALVWKQDWDDLLPGLRNDVRFQGCLWAREWLWRPVNQPGEDRNENKEELAP